MDKRIVKLEADIKEVKTAMTGSNDDGKTLRGRTEAIEQRMKGSQSELEQLKG